MLKRRCIICAKDIQMITGKSERYAHYLIQKMKAFFKKENHQFITVREFSEFSGITLEEIREYLY
ncbi:hypothetical protein PBT90_11005 [Algoriphagus halophytocola]|uniref:Uncharacterized protein n=1 Tax=Algoriphagus halophytocola TaxID=2991499 RepID=A0ABY6MJF3_9BACT|nr:MULTISPECIES: hypothetical protein [unclassified Algoriphagus]UZD23916.1 hypothetical protein OM944_05345 [Algoriphagus sp. TR-M5]WBL41284.1 hypothetical protein PBT90_11005 [Algoriphagus sp. TR-M9]